jgi:hypothetical protein
MQNKISHEKLNVNSVNTAVPYSSIQTGEIHVKRQMRQYDVVRI